MLIDFAAEHRRIFREHGSTEFLNPEAKGNAIHIATEQVFSNAGLGIAIAAKDLIQDTQLKGVSCYLKLTFSHRSGGTYLLHKDPRRVTLQLNSGDARQLYTWLVGGTDVFDAEIGSPQYGLKRLSGRAEHASDDLLLIAENRIHESNEQARIPVSLNLEAQLKLQAYCIAFIRLLYPSLNDQAAAELLTLRSVSARRFGLHSQPRAVAVEAPMAPPAADPPPKPAPERSPEVVRKAIFAIGKQKWPAQRIDVIKYIQENVDISGMQILIDQANAGDFRRWDGLADMLDGAARGTP